MTDKYFFIIALVIALSIPSCSSQEERLLQGKWVLAGTMIGGTPSSFWFQWNGVVTAPWEKESLAFLSEGTYDIPEKGRLRVTLRSGYYKGKTYFFRIVSISSDKLVLANEYEDIVLKRIE